MHREFFSLKSYVPQFILISAYEVFEIKSTHIPFLNHLRVSTTFSKAQSPEPFKAWLLFISALPHVQPLPSRAASCYTECPVILAMIKKLIEASGLSYIPLSQAEIPSLPCKTSKLRSQVISLHAGANLGDPPLASYSTLSTFLLWQLLYFIITEDLCLYFPPRTIQIIKLLLSTKYSPWRAS